MNNETKSVKANAKANELIASAQAALNQPAHYKADIALAITRLKEAQKVMGW